MMNSIFRSPFPQAVKDAFRSPLEGDGSLLASPRRSSRAEQALLPPLLPPPPKKKKKKKRVLAINTVKPQRLTPNSHSFGNQLDRGSVFLQRAWVVEQILRALGFCLLGSRGLSRGGSSVHHAVSGLRRETSNRMPVCISARNYFRNVQVRSLRVIPNMQHKSLFDKDRKKEGLLTWSHPRPRVLGCSLSLPILSLVSLRAVESRLSTRLRPGIPEEAK